MYKRGGNVGGSEAVYGVMDTAEVANVVVTGTGDEDLVTFGRYFQYM